MWWQYLRLLTASLPSSFLAALKCRRQAHHCLRWCMGCFELRKGCNLLSGFAATRSCCKAHSEGWEIHLKHSLSYKAVWKVFARDSIVLIGCKTFQLFDTEMLCVWGMQETLRTRGLRDDTTCLVVDLVPPSNSQHAAPPVKKKKSSLQRILFWRRKGTRLSGALSGVPVMEQLFEEGSAMLADRLVVMPCWLMHRARTNNFCFNFLSMPNCLLVYWNPLT
jgi:hypothetical protein